MADQEFNLLEEPWIRVMKEDCTIEEVSLTDAILRAQEYRGLAGELPTQNAAVLRLMLAVLHAVFERVNADGEEEEIENAKMARKRWESLWKLGQFPEEPLREYLDSQRDNFWLFHPTRPFWQNAEIVFDINVGKYKDTHSGKIFEKGEKQEEPVKKLNGAISESGHKVRLFSERNADEKDTLTYSEAARWLISMNQYDDNTLKTWLGVALLGQFAAIIAKGRTLFETLMLNLVMIGHNEEVWEIGKASWEKPYHYKKDVQTIAMPHDPVAILSYHSRYGKLERENGKITKYVSPKGGICFEEISFDEQMAIWSNNEIKDYKMLKKQLWREFPSIIADEEGTSLLLRWHNDLIHHHSLPGDFLLCYEVIAIEYGKSNMSVENIYCDTLQLHADILGELGKTYRTDIKNEIALCEKAAKNIGNLADDLFYASGGHHNPKKKMPMPSVAAQKQYYYIIDVPFRRWLTTLDAEDSEAERTQKINTWRTEAKLAAERLAKEMVADAGPAAFVGKTVKANGNQPSVYYCSSQAKLKFDNKLKKVWG